MNAPNSDRKQCEQTRGQMDAYLSNELLVETTSEVLSHLESCEACSRELESRMRVREALRKAAAKYSPSEHLRQAIHQRLRKAQPGLFSGSRATTWVFALAALALVVVAGAVAQHWFTLGRGRQIVASVLALGVSDHVQCAIRGHNYPEVAHPHEELEKKLGPEYAGLLPVVEGKLSGFQVLEAHICSVPGSSRKYVHFIARGRGTILSVILTKRDGESLPAKRSLVEVSSSGVGLYQAQLEGFRVAGFESNEYFGFVVSDLDQSEILQVAAAVGPPLRDALDSGSGTARTETPGRVVLSHWI